MSIGELRQTPIAKEVEAIRVLVATLDDLDSETRARVLRYLNDRFTPKPVKRGFLGLPIPEPVLRRDEVCVIPDCGCDGRAHP